MNIIDLPKDVINTVMSYLPIESVIKLGCTCRTFKLLCEDDKLWRAAAQRFNMLIDLQQPARPQVFYEMREITLIATDYNRSDFLEKNLFIDQNSFENTVNNLIEHFKKPFQDEDKKKKSHELLMERLLRNEDYHLVRVASNKHLLEPTFQNLKGVIEHRPYCQNPRMSDLALIFEELLMQTEIAEDKKEGLLTLAIKLRQQDIVKILQQFPPAIFLV